MPDLDLASRLIFTCLKTAIFKPYVHLYLTIFTADTAICQLEQCIALDSTLLSATCMARLQIMHCWL